jgi:leucyl-tRNA synthetase
VVYHVWCARYGETEWRAQVQKHVDGTLETYDEKTKDGFDRTLDWLHEHACSRRSVSDIASSL